MKKDNKCFVAFTMFHVGLVIHTKDKTTNKSRPDFYPHGANAQPSRRESTLTNIHDRVSVSMITQASNKNYKCHQIRKIWTLLNLRVEEITSFEGMT